MMKRFGFMMILILPVFLPAISHAMGGYAAMPSEKPVINRVMGEVSVKSDGSDLWRDAKTGMLLNSGDTVKTGPDGKCEIYHAGGAFRMYVNTLIVIPLLEAQENAVSIKRVRMEHGAGIFRSSPHGIEDEFEVQTLHVIAGVKGTIFSVLNIQNGAIISVFRGKVLVTDTERSPDTETRLGPGRRVTVRDGHGFGIIQTFSPWNAWRGWSSDDTPPLEDPSPQPEGGDGSSPDYSDNFSNNTFN